MANGIKKTIYRLLSKAIMAILAVAAIFWWALAITIELAVGCFVSDHPNSSRDWGWG